VKLGRLHKTDRDIMVSGRSDSDFSSLCLNTESRSIGVDFIPPIRIRELRKAFETREAELVAARYLEEE
jgi:hypothetical protein